MGRLRHIAAFCAVIILVGLMPATSADSAGEYGDVRPTAILRSIGGGAQYTFQGLAMAVSADGNTAIVAGGEARPRGGDSNGQVCVWVRTDGAWHKQAVINPPPSHSPATRFGSAVSLSPNGRYLAISDPWVSTNGEGFSEDGAVYVYERTAIGWAKSATIPDPGTGLDDGFGENIAISLDGSLVVTAPSGASSTTTNLVAWAVNRTTHGWGPAQPIAAAPGAPASGAGDEVALSADGRHAAVGNASADYHGATYAGNVLMFDRSDAGTWTAGAAVTDRQPTKDAGFGSSIAMSSDGNTLVVGSQPSNGMRSGVGVFRHDTGTWVRSAQFYGNYSFGSSVAVSATGNVVAVGVPYRDSATASSSGGVHRYRRTGTSWSYLGVTYIKGAGEDELDGYAVALAGNTDQLFFSAPGYGRTDDAHTGAVFVIG